MKKRLIQTAIVTICTVALLFSGSFGETPMVEVKEEPVALSGMTGTAVHQTQDDLAVIPDRYNTGASGSLLKVGLGENVNGIEFVAGSGGTRNTIDFRYRNTDVSGVITFANYDFSDYPISIEKTTEIARNIKLVFNNCRFSGIGTNKEDSNVTFEFNDCTIENFSGSNAVFNNCKFGASYSDAINPFRNVKVNNCFISDLGSEKATDKEIHTDGTQMYGADGIDVKNVVFKNCRFEIPPVSPEGSTAGINACIMIQLEFSNAKGVNFENCIVNGGGYSIYAWDKNKGYSLENVNLKGIRVGCAKSQGTIYPRISSGVVLENVTETDSLYIASVWKEDGEAHLSVSNDTNQERTLLVYTDKGEYTYVIPACKKGSQMTSADVYGDMPFDVDVIVPADCRYVVCFDNTYTGCASQIRFVNWGTENVYLPETVVKYLTSGRDDVLYSGVCGEQITFALTKSGVFTLEGSGATYSYTSTKLAPWSEYSNLIKEVKIGDGIEKIGEQLFQNCSAIQTVSFPDTLTEIGKRAFAGCTSLTSVTLPAGVEELGTAAFPYATLKKVCYEGVNWETINSNGDEVILSSKVVYVTEYVSTSKVILQGKCGYNVTYSLTGDGVLQINGTGDTYNYNSVKVAPWYEYRELIKEVQVSNGINKIGEQLFRNCVNLCKVELPKGLTIIGKNAFISCKSLKYIELPNSIREIQARAFAAAGISYATYNGSIEEWGSVKIAAYNDILYHNFIYITQ